MGLEGGLQVLRAVRFGHARHVVSAQQANAADVPAARHSSDLQSQLAAGPRLIAALGRQAESNMEHLTIYFRHGIRDVVPYSNFIADIGRTLSGHGLGEYLGDDMAVDGGDAEGVFSCSSAKELFEILKGPLSKLSFMKGAKVTLIYGELESGAPTQEIYLP